MSYAIDTSPAAVNEWGMALVIVVSATPKRDEVLSVTLKRLPTLPLAPILMVSKSPVATVVVVGDQSKERSLPELRDVEVEERDRRLAVESELAVNTAALVVAKMETRFKGAEGVVVPIPTYPSASMRNGVESVNVPSSLTLKPLAVPAWVISKT